MDKPSILVFGAGDLQKSLIQQCKALGLFTVGIDIAEGAACRNEVDAFEVAAGDDYDKTLEIAEKYHISGVITTATDKPLVMMARIAQTMQLPFYSVKTAEWSTDKLLMKQRFRQHGIPCAAGIEISDGKDLDNISWDYPVIVKPRDNSGSRGVVFCKDRRKAENILAETFEYTHRDTILVEEYIDGQEYSVESLHYHGQTIVIQFTQKLTTDDPYNVEIGHIQPAGLTEEQERSIRVIIEKTADAMGFDNCASHTELKVNGDGIYMIETSPRLGGDYITSDLTLLSTGVNIERLLIRMSIGEIIEREEFDPPITMSSGIVYFKLPQGRIRCINNMDKITDIDGCLKYVFNKRTGDTINEITNSLNRYGYAVFQTDSREKTVNAIENAKATLREAVTIYE